MSDKRAPFLIWIGVSVVALGLFLWLQPRTHKTILRVALPDTASGRRLREAIPGLRAAMKSVDIHVYAMPYDDLYDSLHAQADYDGEADTPQQFDVVLVDDPWIAELASRHVLSPIPDAVIEQDAGTISDYAPEFLRVCFYRDTVPRRPSPGEMRDPAQLKKDYRLYALPYMGNMQALAVSPQVRSVVETSGDEKLTWQRIAAQTGSKNVQFYSRLGSDNGALVDFLPILWSSGGSLVRRKGDREVSGFTGSANSPERKALQTSVNISLRSSPEYSRFDEEELFDYIGTQPNLLSVAWIAFRGRHKPGLEWYTMPASESHDSSSLLCAGDEEAGCTGGMGLWSLAIEAKASESGVAAKFVRLAVQELSKDKGIGCTDVSGKAGRMAEEDDPTYPTPLASKMSCEVRYLLKHASPRPSHPKWHDIEKTVGLRIREAHWQTIEVGEAACLAAQDLNTIVLGKSSTFDLERCRHTGSERLAVPALTSQIRHAVP